MISKELMSEVLNLNITYIERCNNSIIYKISVYDREEEVNIYELAHKCKEWALKQKDKDKFFIAQQFAINIESQMGVIKDYWCVLLTHNSRISPEFSADTEPQAIFKACQWILDNKQKGKI